MKGCRRIVMLVSESHDRELSRWESFRLGFHINICLHCRRYATSIDQLRAIMETYTHIPEVQEPELQDLELQSSEKSPDDDTDAEKES